MKRLIPLLVMLIGAAGCGYHLANNGGAIPSGTRVVAVLPFANHTSQPQLSQTLSAAVAREFMGRTRYHIQATVAGSDVALHGDLLSVVATPVTYDPTTGRATTMAVTLRLRAWLTAEPSGKELFRNDDMVFHDEYEISNQPQNFIEEDSSAYQRLSNTLAQTLVSDILEAF